MKKLILVLLFLPLISFGQKIKGKKLFSINAGVGEWQSSVGEYLNLKTIYAPYTKGVFDGIAKGKVLPIGGDYPLYYQENGKTFSDLDIDMVERYQVIIHFLHRLGALIVSFTIGYFLIRYKN